MELDTLMRPMSTPAEPLDLYSLHPYPEDQEARADSRRCFVTKESKTQVVWTDLAQDQIPGIPQVFNSLAELRGYTSLQCPRQNGLRIISISQPNSWKALNVTREMFWEIVNTVGASSELLALPLSFFPKRDPVEEGFSSAPVVRLNGDSLEVIYIVKYAFEKPLEEKGKENWVLRQTGVYYKYEFASKNSTWLFLHPTPNCKFQRRLTQFLESDQRANLQCNPLLIHSILFGTFFPAWRDYLKELESRILPVANDTVASEIDKPLQLNHESLTAVRRIENRCLVLQPIFPSLDKIFDVLHQANAALAERGATQPAELQAMKQLLNNYSTIIDSYRQAVWSLQSRISRIAAHITDTLSFKDAFIAKRQSEFILRDSTTVRVITVVTLIYLPSTFMATLLGMNSFFEMDDSRHIVVSPQFWIYIVCAVPLTAATLCYWWYFQKAKQRSEPTNDVLMV